MLGVIMQAHQKPYHVSWVNDEKILVTSKVQIGLLSKNMHRDCGATWCQ